MIVGTGVITYMNYNIGSDYRGAMQGFIIQYPPDYHIYR